MNLADNCAICRVSMLRRPALRVHPCCHLFHVSCSKELVDGPDALCPLCRTPVMYNEEVVRKTYNRNTVRDRERIVACANKGEDWVQLATTLNVNYKTAFQWVRSGRDFMLKKGGQKRKALMENQIDSIIEWLEQDSSYTLKQLQAKILAEFQVIVSISTIGNYLEGRLFTMKQVHTQPATMNSPVNKEMRAEYVRCLNSYIQQGKQIVWIDQTNFNLFCRRARGRSRAGARAVQILPSSRGPNVHLIGGISAAGIVAMDRRRGSFTADSAIAWVRNLMVQWENGGNELADLVIVCDNAPCHSRLETALNGTTATLLRLAPYSPMLNPIETIWSKIKTYVRTHLGIPPVAAPGVIEQRLVYLEQIIDDAKNSIVGGDCARAAQHSTIHHATAIALGDMPVGL